MPAAVRVLVSTIREADVRRTLIEFTVAVEALRQTGCEPPMSARTPKG
jgi:hypothetical protein